MVDDSRAATAAAPPTPARRSCSSCALANAGALGRRGAHAARSSCDHPDVIILGAGGACPLVPVGGEGLLGIFEVEIARRATPSRRTLDVRPRGHRPPPGHAGDLAFELAVGGWFDDVETDRGWTLGAPGDDATAGLWVRADPVGTDYNGRRGAARGRPHGRSRARSASSPATRSPGDAAGDRRRRRRQDHAAVAGLRPGRRHVRPRSATGAGTPTTRATTPARTTGRSRSPATAPTGWRSSTRRRPAPTWQQMTFDLGDYIAADRPRCSCASSPATRAAARWSRPASTTSCSTPASARPRRWTTTVAAAGAHPGRQLPQPVQPGDDHHLRAAAGRRGGPRGLRRGGRRVATLVRGVVIRGPPRGDLAGPRRPRRRGRQRRLLLPAGSGRRCRPGRCCC